MPTNSVLYICSGVPWASNYQHIRLFSSPTEQLQNILSFKKYGPFSDFSFIREEENTVIRVPFNSEELKDCNYIVFQNPAFDSDYIFAFIKSIVYKGQNSSWIYFEVDKFQTWFLKCNIQPSFVEREHTNNDTIGANTVPENLELGPYITTAKSTTGSNMSIAWCATEIPEDFAIEDVFSGGVVNGFPFPLVWKYYGSTSNADVKQLAFDLGQFAKAGKSDAIVSVFCVPTFANPEQGNANPKSFIHTPAARTLSFTPKNNKLYCYPFCGLIAYSNGSQSEMRYENFNGVAQFQVYASFGPNPECVMFPRNYEGVTENTKYSVYSNSWPLIPWIKDYYQNWIAQNKVAIANSNFKTALKLAGGLGAAGLGLALAPVTGGASAAATVAAATTIAGTLASTITDVTSTITQVTQAQIVPDNVNGNVNAADVLDIANLGGFFTECRTIKPEYGQIIDDYFTMFGYKTNRLKQPNITGRAAFNYVKTIGANVTGKAPNEILSFIANMLDRGITFWHTNDVGNYSLKNSIV